LKYRKLEFIVDGLINGYCDQFASVTDDTTMKPAANIHRTLSLDTYDTILVPFVILLIGY
jgi:hypothetical protein